MGIFTKSERHEFKGGSGFTDTTIVINKPNVLGDILGVRQNAWRIFPRGWGNGVEHRSEPIDAIEALRQIELFTGHHC